MVKDEIPLAYLPGGVARVHIRVVGDLREPEHSTTPKKPPPMPPAPQPAPDTALQQSALDTQNIHAEASSSAADEKPQDTSSPSEHDETWEQQASFSMFPLPHRHLLSVHDCTAMHKKVQTEY